MTGIAFRLATVLLPVLYFSLAAAGSKEIPEAATLGRRRLVTAVGWLAALLHFGLFVMIHVETGASPLVLPGAALSALALALYLIYAWVELQSRVRSLRAPVLSAVFVIQVAASGIGFSAGARLPEATTLFVIHVVTIIASAATLLLSGFFGFVYLVMEKEMRAQRFGPLFSRLPKLSELSSMNRRAATIGFVLMTIGYNLGIWQAHASGRKGFSYLDPIVLITMATWVAFGLIVLSRWVPFLSGRKAAVTAICGIVLLVLTVLVSVVPGLSFHRLW